MKTDREKAIVIMRRKGSYLFPVSPFDDEVLCGVEAGKDVEVTFKQRRSVPQMRLYWVMLAGVVAATECHASAERLHDALKFAMGYTTPLKLMDGQIVMVPDSIAFSRMGPDEFKGFFDRAARLIGETYGIDPLALEKVSA